MVKVIHHTHAQKMVVVTTWSIVKYSTQIAINSHILIVIASGNYLFETQVDQSDHAMEA